MLNFTSLRRGHGFAEMHQDSRCETMQNRKWEKMGFKIKSEKVKIAGDAGDGHSDRKGSNAATSFARYCTHGLNGPQLFN